MILYSIQPMQRWLSKAWKRGIGDIDLPQTSLNTDSRLLLLGCSIIEALFRSQCWISQAAVRVERLSSCLLPWRLAWDNWWSYLSHHRQISVLLQDYLKMESGFRPPNLFLYLQYPGCGQSRLPRCFHLKNTSRKTNRSDALSGRDSGRLHYR